MWVDAGVTATSGQRYANVLLASDPRSLSDMVVQRSSRVLWLKGLQAPLLRWDHVQGTGNSSFIGSFAAALGL